MTADSLTRRFAFGVVSYEGADLVPFGDELADAPLSTLWG